MFTNVENDIQKGAESHKIADRIKQWGCTLPSPPILRHWLRQFFGLSSFLLCSYNPINFEALDLMEFFLYKKRLSLVKDNNKSIGVFEEDYRTRVRTKRDRIDN